MFSNLSSHEKHEFISKSIEAYNPINKRVLAISIEIIQIPLTTSNIPTFKMNSGVAKNKIIKIATTAILKKISFIKIPPIN
jgi:hypothetical protein